MDFKKTKWIEEKRRDWPEGSLKRFLMLNYPECKTAREALAKVIKDKAELDELRIKLKEAEGKDGKDTPGR